jgi:hypothetical protein
MRTFPLGLLPDGHRITQVTEFVSGFGIMRFLQVNADDPARRRENLAFLWREMHDGSSFPKLVSALVCPIIGQLNRHS